MWCDAKRPVSRSRPMGWAFGQLVERCLYGSIQLRILTSGIVLRRVVHLAVRVGPVVLGTPADVVEEERELGLRGDRTVYQVVARPDADDAAPGPLADQR